MGKIRISIPGLNYASGVQAKLHIKSAFKTSEYYPEIPQSQTADKPVASWGRATQQSRDTRKTNKAKQPALSSPSRWLQN